MQAALRRPARSWLLATLLLVILSALASLILAACAVGSSGATPTPTRTPRPTSTRVRATATAIDALALAITTATPRPAPTQVPPTQPAQPGPTALPATAAPTAPRPPTAVPPTAAPAPVRPAATAVPTSPPAPADPCANIGDDGCKWRVTGGPTFGANGGSELKLQLLFIHSGIDGGQPQGSYFIVLEKDGQNLKIPDSVRSIAGATSQGTLGRYNYEYALGKDRLPGNTIAGSYTLWVLDGNGVRDSQNVTFTVPADQGQLWIQFDQS